MKEKKIIELGMQVLHQLIDAIGEELMPKKKEKKNVKRKKVSSVDRSGNLSR